MRRLLDTGLAVAAFLGAFLLRTLPAADEVLGGRSVSFRTPDPLYHMRVVDLLIEHFPRPVLHDRLLLWPGGMDLPTAPLFDYLVAGTALLLGRGAPSPRLVDLCGAFWPPLLGALLAAAGYLLGRRPLGREGAALTAALLAVLPGQLLQRCALGYADHHAPALLFLGLFVLFLFRTLGPCDEKAARRDALAAGGSLSLLVLSWPWGAAFALPAMAWAALDAGVRREPRSLRRLTWALAAAALPVLGSSTLFPVLRQPAVLLVGLALAAAAASRARTRAGLAAILSSIALGAGATALVVAPGALGEVVARLAPTSASLTVAEAQPLFEGGAILSPLLAELWTGLFAAAIGAALALRRLRDRPENGLLLALLVFTTGLALLQRRFSGEMAIVAALLAGLVPGHLVTSGSGVPPRRAAIGRALVLSGLGLLLVVPAALAAPSAVRSLPPSTNPDWEAAAAFLKEKTRDPLADGSASPGSILTWWDNGYAVVRLGHRIPVTNPTQAEADWAARALLAEDEGEALALLRSRSVTHVVLDAALTCFSPPGFPVPLGQFPALPIWAGRTEERYLAAARTTGPGGDRPTTLFFAPYFRTLAFRLWRHGGRAAAPAGPVMAARMAGAVVAEVRRFGGYAEAEAFVAGSSGGWRLASEDAYATCVPLEAWTGFTRVFSSAMDTIRGPLDRVARVEILAVGPSPAPVAP